MTIREHVGNNALPMGVYNVGFGEDETQFFAGGIADLESLWYHFCHENNLDPMDVEYVELVETDEEILEEYLEASGALLGKYGTTWVLYCKGESGRFSSWYDLISTLDSWNEALRRK